MQRTHELSPHKFTPMPGVHKAIERTADACRKAYDITLLANMHRFPDSADGDVRRHAHRWRYVNPKSGFTRDFITPQDSTS